MKKALVLIILGLLSLSLCSCKPALYTENAYQLGKTALEICEKISTLDISPEDASMRLEDIKKELDELSDVESVNDSKYQFGTSNLWLKVSSVALDIKLYTIGGSNTNFDKDLKELRDELNKGSAVNAVYTLNPTISPSDYDMVTKYGQNALAIADKYIGLVKTHEYSADDMNKCKESLDAISKALFTCRNDTKNKYAIDMYNHVNNIIASMHTLSNTIDAGAVIDEYDFPFSSLVDEREALLAEISK